MANWKVIYEPRVEGDLELAFSSGELGIEDAEILKSWVREIEMNGPEFIQNERVWDDHALEGEWFGYRASCFGPRGRIIYRIEDNLVVVRVVRITNTHDYRKG